MFTTISWSNYIIAISTLLLIWYLILGFRFYSYELRQLLLGQSKIKIPFFNHRKRKELNFNSNDIANMKVTLDDSFPEYLASAKEVEELSTRLASAVAESAERNISKVEFSNYVQLILGEYPYLKKTFLRTTINELTVSECEKHPQLLLTYAEVDGLWEEETV